MNRILKKILEDYNDRSEFPLDVLPTWAKDYIVEHHQKSNWPFASSGVAVIAVIATAIGGHKIFKWKWEGVPGFWFCVVGYPGSNKTHPISGSLTPIHQHDKRSAEIFSSAHAEYLRNRNNENRIPEPKLHQIITTDTTVEALIKLLSTNTAGVLIWKDELYGWFQDMNRYSGGGGDQEHYLSMFSNQPISVNRKTNPIPLRVEKPVVSLIGTIQPGVLRKLIIKNNLLENGVLDRFLFSIIDEGGNPYTKEVARITSEDKYNANIETLLSMRSNEVVYTPDEEAMDLLVVYMNYLQEKGNNSLDEREGAMYSKLETYTHRLPQVLHLSHKLKMPGNSHHEVIGVDVIKKMIRLLLYFEYMGLYVRKMVNAENRIETLDRRQQSFYKKIPPSFTTGEAIEIGESLQIPSRTVEKWISPKNRRFRGLIKKECRGKYKKLVKQ